MFLNHRQFRLGLPQWLQRLLQSRQTTGPTLVQSRQDQTLAVFQPMAGDGTFGASCWATWQRDTTGQLQVNLAHTTPLTYAEQCRLCLLHETHFSWWMKVDGGAFMVVKPYRRGVTGEALPFPVRETHSDGGGSRV